MLTVASRFLQAGCILHIPNDHYKGKEWYCICKIHTNTYKSHTRDRRGQIHLPQAVRQEVKERYGQNVKLDSIIDADSVRFTVLAIYCDLHERIKDSAHIFILY